MFMNVDLPEPEAPMTATNSPRRIDTLMPRSASTSMSPMRYTLRRSRIRMTSAAALRGSSQEKSRAGSEAKRTPRCVRARLRRARHRHDDLLAFFDLAGGDLRRGSVGDPETDPDRRRFAVAQHVERAFARAPAALPLTAARSPVTAPIAAPVRSEERRVGKECRSRWSA